MSQRAWEQSSTNLDVQELYEDQAFVVVEVAADVQVVPQTHYA
jgi:hypothetical protein